MTTPEINVLPEPSVEFRFAQELTDPHSGLALFGPRDADSGASPASLLYGVVGTNRGIGEAQTFFTRLRDPITSADATNPKASALWPVYPGYEAIFSSRLPDAPAWTGEVDDAALRRNLKDRDPNARAYALVNAYLEQIAIAAGRDENFGTIICVVPDEIWRDCRPESRIVDGVGRKPTGKERETRRRQPDLFGEYESEQYEYSVDFRRQLKARVMEHGIPVQIIRESTLYQGSLDDIQRGLTPLSDRAWNISTTLYYKSGGKPWRLASAREGVCYVGIAFRRTDPDRGNEESACCAAQMFLDTGDGVVFRGEFGPWYSPPRKQFHLERDAARNLLRGVIDAYREQGGQELKEIFLHARSSISSEEFEGYAEACPPGTKLVGVRVRSERNGLRLYREGDWPVIRGTFMKNNDRSAYLWTAGYKPELLTYDGWEVPIPLRIDIQHGDADIAQVVRDIFGLTKLNYNTCRIGDHDPVTVKFSNAVGEILVSNPTTKQPRKQFKFYI